MSESFCICEDWYKLKNENHELFSWQPPYGWIIKWVELTDDYSATRFHWYGVKINYCPMCGRPLKSLEEDTTSD